MVFLLTLTTHSNPWNPNPKLGSSKFQRLEARLLQNVSFSVRMNAASPSFDPDLSVVMEAIIV